MAIPSPVQSVAWPSTRSLVSGTVFTWPLPNPSLAGNTLIFVFTCANPAPSITSVKDNFGNSFTAGPSTTGAGSGQAVFMYYMTNAPVGVTGVVLTIGAATTFLQAAASEWVNITAINGAGIGNDTATPSTSLQATGTIGTAGDLIYQYAIGINFNVGKFTAAGGFGLLVADRLESQVVQYQVAGAAVTNPTITSATSQAYSTVAAAFTSGIQGTSPPAGLRVQRVQFSHDDGTEGTTIGVQFPCTGNLIVMGGPMLGANINCAPTVIIDSHNNNWQQVGGSPIDNGAGGTAALWYAANPITSEDTTLTIKTGITPAGSNYIFFDVVGALTPNPFDVAGTATGNQASPGNLSTVAITPSVVGGVAFCFGDQNSSTILGTVADSNSHKPTFLMPTWSGQDEGGAGGAGTTWTDDASAAMIYITDTTQLTFVWNPTRATLEWENVAAAFKAGAVSPMLIMGQIIL